MVGDADQLQSVGAGDVFRELIDCGLIPVTVLNEIFRQKKDSLIAYNAQKINPTMTPAFSTAMILLSANAPTRRKPPNTCGISIWHR